MRQVSCLDEDFKAGIAGGCVALLSVGYCLEGGVGTRLQGQGKVVFGCALMRARAGRAFLPYWQHLLEVTFCALKLSSVRRLMC